MQQSIKLLGMLDRKEANALLHMLSMISTLEEDNVYSEDARKLMDKILKHGRTFTHKGSDKVSIYFYDNEASMLIQLVSMYLSAVQENTEDYYDRIGRSRKRGLGNSQSAEQTISDKTEN